MDFEPNYELVNATDQTIQIFFVNTDEQPRKISVYGSLRSEILRQKAPEELVALFDVATSFTHPSGKPWLPSKIEVMIWPYEHAPDESIVWPSEWPDINHPETVQRGPEAYSIFLPSEFYFEFKQFLNRRNAKGAVEINGNKWAVSMRFPFPAEHQWMFGFDE